MSSIYINQLGYRPCDAKKAAFLHIEAQVSAHEDYSFCVIRQTDKKIVYKGITNDPVKELAAMDTVRIADFSEFTEEGEYIVCAGSSEAIASYPFIISKDPYKNLRKGLLEMFNYQKCGADMDCGIWSHPACHTAPAVIYGTDIKKDVSGGWHDAGDYGRYIVPASKAVADLLLAHELSPNPDDNLLEIVWHEILWMQKMQDEKSGGVYHKVTCEQFNALDEMPHEEHEELIICPASTTATAGFAAAMALASRFYPDKKDALVNAARRAWDWCMANKDIPGFENPPGIRTGGYSDDNYKDELFWASCELFCATLDEKYHDYIKSSELYTGLGWNNVGTYGIIAYLLHAKDNAQSVLKHRMVNTLISLCDDILNKCINNPYGVSLGETYRWGSNMTVCNNAMTLLLGSRFSPNSLAYIEGAMEHFHYLLGRNSLSISFITGFGTNAAKNPHHRLSVAKGKTVPGMVVGGPCMHINRDPALNEFRTGYPPAKRYIDNVNSFASNEVTIYWNSPAYFITAFLGF